MKRQWPFLLLTSMIGLVSCGDSAFEKDYQEAKKHAGQPDFGTALVSLDQRYPDRLAVKVDLGALAMASGAWDQARSYLGRGETLAGSSSDNELKSVLWADLAQLWLLKGDDDQALVYANRSLQNKDEKLGVVFTRAKARLVKGDQKAALADFQQGWDSRRSTMTAQDYGLYAKALVAEKNYARALEVLESYRDSLPYEVGTGLVESLCYENLGRYDESVLAAYIDVNYQQSRGLIPGSQVLTNVRNLETRIKSRGLAPEKSGLTTLKSVEAWVTEDWQRVDFDNTLLASSLDARFLKLAAILEVGRPGAADLQAYSELERRFHDFPSYYLPLIHYFRDVRKDVRNAGFAALAEKVVNLGPDGPWAGEGRRALAQGYGLAPDQSSGLLTRAEVDRALGQGDWAKILRLWTTPDNPSVQYSVERLQSLVQDSTLRATLRSLETGASGKAKERMNLVLQGR